MSFILFVKIINFFYFKVVKISPFEINFSVFKKHCCKYCSGYFFFVNENSV